jgi:hypothetical protein
VPSRATVPVESSQTGAVSRGDEEEQKAAGRIRRERPRRGRDDGGVQFARCPPDAQPVLSAPEAVAVFEARWGIVWRRYGEPEAELMLARNDRPFLRPARGETFVSAFSERLVWVLTWHDTYPPDAQTAQTAQMARSGGPGWISMPDREALRGRAILVGTGIVDATTGDVLAIFEGIDVPHDS